MSPAGFSFIQGPAQHQGWEQQLGTPRNSSWERPEELSEELRGAASIDLTLAKGVHAVKLRSP